MTGTRGDGAAATAKVTVVDARALNTLAVSNQVLLRWIRHTRVLMETNLQMSWLSFVPVTALTRPPLAYLIQKFKGNLECGIARGDI